MFPRMADFSAKRIDDMQATFGGGFIKARAELGVKAFGMQVLDFPPDNSDGYPEHDHAETGQEEVYAVLRGTGRMQVGDEEIELSPDVLVRVGPEEKRRIASGPEGLRILALGGVPGQPYEINPATDLQTTA
jgi:mannose-6-phosphate isomerase-like protein (cupin superfamily)